MGTRLLGHFEQNVTVSLSSECHEMLLADEWRAIGELSKVFVREMMGWLWRPTPLYDALIRERSRGEGDE